MSANKVWGRLSLISLRAITPIGAPVPKIDSLLICQNLTTLTFDMFAAAQKLWHKEDAAFLLSSMCSDLATQFVWLSAQEKDTTEQYLNDFISLVKDLNKEFADRDLDTILMLLGTSLDRNDNYSTVEWCAIVISAAMRAGYEFDF